MEKEKKKDEENNWKSHKDESYRKHHQKLMDVIFSPTQVDSKWSANFNIQVSKTNVGVWDLDNIVFCFTFNIKWLCFWTENYVIQVSNSNIGFGDLNVEVRASLRIYLCWTENNIHELLMMLSIALIFVTLSIVLFILLLFLLHIQLSVLKILCN